MRSQQCQTQQTNEIQTLLPLGDSADSLSRKQSEQHQSATVCSEEEKRAAIRKRDLEWKRRNQVARNPTLYPDGIWRRTKPGHSCIASDPIISEKLSRIRAAGFWKKATDTFARRKIARLGDSFDSWFTAKQKVRADRNAGINATGRKRINQHPYKYVNGVYNTHWRGIANPERTATRIEILRWVGVLWSDEKSHRAYAGNLSESKFHDHIKRLILKQSRSGETPEQKRERARAYARNLWANNHEVRAAKKKYRLENRDKSKKWKSAYRARNIEKVRAQALARGKKRRKEDPYYRMVLRQRHRLYVFATRHGFKKPKRNETFGCDHAFLRNYLESKFSAGMSWSNYGQWHIDHIRPCASFDLRDPEQVKACFHYSNLQPLWAVDNMKKGDAWSVAA